MAAPRRLCDESLLQRLMTIPAEYIDALCDIVTDFGKGRASLDADIKKTLVMARHDPRPERYTQDHLMTLIRELQDFGGHSVANLVRHLRDLPPLSYEAIVNDVYKKLNGRSADKKTIEVKESDIARALFGDASSSLTLKERIERSTSTKVISGLFFVKPDDSTSKRMQAGGLGIFASVLPTALPIAGKLVARLNPITAAASTASLVTYSISTEAYRITIPFVAEMGWIAMQLKRRGAAKKSNGPTPAAAHDATGAVARPATRNPHGKQGSAVVLADENGKPLMRFTAFDHDLPGAAGTRLPKQAINALNPLVSNLPSVAALAEQQRGNYVLCSLPFDSLVNSRTGAEGAKRAFVIGANGIQEHAHITAPEALQNIVISGVAWNALSSVVGQKHLHDINEKLTAIQERLDELAESVEGLRLEKLEGLMTYVQRLLDHHDSEQVDARALDRLEYSLVDMTGLEAFFRKKMTEELEKVGNIQTGKLVGAATVRTEIEASMERMNKRVQGYLQVAQLQIVTLWLLNSSEPRARYQSSAADVLESMSELDDIILQCRHIYPAQMSMSSSLKGLTKDETADFELKMQSLCKSTDIGRIDTRDWYERLFETAECEMLLHIGDDGNIEEAKFFDLLERS